MDSQIWNWIFLTLTAIGSGFIRWIMGRLSKLEQEATQRKTSLALVIQKLDTIDKRFEEHIKHEEAQHEKVAEDINEIKLALAKMPLRKEN